MFIIIALLSIFTFSRTLSYGIFEIKKNSNIIGGITIIAISIVTLIMPSIMLHLRGTA